MAIKKVKQELKSEYGETGLGNYQVEPQDKAIDSKKEGSTDSLPARKMVPANKKSLSEGAGRTITVREK